MPHHTGTDDLLNIFNFLVLKYSVNDLCSKVDNLDSTDDGEPSEKSHSASNC